VRTKKGKKVFREGKGKKQVVVTRWAYWKTSRICSELCKLGLREKGKRLWLHQLGGTSIRLWVRFGFTPSGSGSVGYEQKKGGDQRRTAEGYIQPLRSLAIRRVKEKRKPEGNRKRRVQAAAFYIHPPFTAASDYRQPVGHKERENARRNYKPGWGRGEQKGKGKEKEGH